MSVERLILGVITGAHGVRGLLRVKSFTAAPENLCAYGPLTDPQGRVRYDLTLKGMVKGQVLVSLPDCHDRATADSFRGTELFLERSRLPDPGEEDEFYHADLIGLDVFDQNDQPLGTVRTVFDFGSGDILEVAEQDGKTRLYPFTMDVVPTVDISGGRITIIPPETVTAEASEKGKSA